MARMARVVIPGIPHHITQRGNRSQNVFFNDNDKQHYLSLMHEHYKKASIALWAYCLMDNHVHLIVVPEREDSLSKGVGSTHKHYTRMINFREDWRGFLWQGRFSSFPLDEKHLYAAIRYVECNPVRAGLVKRAEEYEFSSARAHIYKENTLILKDNIVTEAIIDWRAYLATGDDQRRSLFQKHSRTGRPLGDDAFIEKLESMSGRNLKAKKPGPKKR